MTEIFDRSKNIGEFVPQLDDDMIVCRCEEITKGEIRKAVHMGLWTMTEVKRFIRPGMGLCQGQTCGNNVRRIIANELNVPHTSLEEVTSRPPVRPIELGTFGNEVESL
ncbi:MAG: (2Fe-2S)-binding protein [Lachnospiraceae bacterium]|nr:(2Fe-2S)-binding protein [Lachnospiraceae bacterium]